MDSVERQLPDSERELDEGMKTGSGKVFRTGQPLFRTISWTVITHLS